MYADGTELVVSGQVHTVQGGTTRSNKTKYDVALTGSDQFGQAFSQNVTAWEGALASQAQALIGQQVQARVKVKINGQYTNYNLDSIAAAGSLPPSATPAPPATPVPAPAPAPSGPYHAPVPLAPPISDQERQKLIVRQNVLGTAFGFVGRLYEGAGPEALEAAKEQAVTLAGELYAKVFSANAQPAPASAPAPQPATPQAVAEQVNGAAESGVAVTVGPDW